MSVIGSQIKKFRIEKGITQEELGQLAGVTTQAVSRWERGGTPDAEILPEIARILDVTIDALFGREEQSVAQVLARRLSKMPNDEAYRYAFGICWAIEIGLLQDTSIMDDFLGSVIDNPLSSKDQTDYFCKLMQDGGMATVRFSPDLRHFFMMTEPKNGINNCLSDIEELRKVFAIFADRDLLKIIFCMYTRINTPIAASLISKKTGLAIDRVERCMETLCKNKLAMRSVIDTADGELYCYQFSQESSIIPLLCFADEICKKDFRDFIWDFSRTTPMFR